MAGRPSIPTNSSALIAIIADEVVTATPHLLPFPPCSLPLLGLADCAASTAALLLHLVVTGVLTCSC